MKLLSAVFLLSLTAGDDTALDTDSGALDIALDKGVMVLGQDTLQTVIDSNSLVLVDFYAPW